MKKASIFSAATALFLAGFLMSCSNNSADKKEGADSAKMQTTDTLKMSPAPVTPMQDTMHNNSTDTGTKGEQPLPPKN